MEKKNGTVIFVGVVCVATLIISIVGATFAYFAAGADNAGTVNGTAAKAGLKLTVTQVSDGEGPMVPLLNGAVQPAITGTTEGTCIDANGNTSCKVYEIVIENTGTSGATLVSDITFSSAGFDNLYFEQINGSKSGEKYTFTKKNPAGTQQLIASGTGYDLVLGTASDDDSNANTVLLGADGTSTDSQTYYLVVWISETSSNQNETDVGSFSGTITFSSASGEGVTSTFEAVA